MKTRARKSGAAAKSETTNPSAEHHSAHSLQPSVKDPPHITILPKHARAQSRIITVPVCMSQGRVLDVPYFVDPTKGFYEFTKISPPGRSTRSWLLVSSDSHHSQTDCGKAVSNTESDADREEEHGTSEEDGYLLSTPALLVATPVDPLMILLAVDGVVFPIKDDHGRTAFSTLDDTIWELKERCPHIRSVLDTNPGCRLERILRSRIASISQKGTVGLGDDGYCVQLPLVARALLKMARKMVFAGLPESMESHFVKPAFEIPEQVLNRNVDIEDGKENSDDADDAILPVTRPPPSNDIVNLLRTRTALHFLLSKYIRADLSRQLQAFWKDPGKAGIDFTPLDLELARIAALKLEAQALRSISDNISRKRSAMDDEEAMEREDAKRRKREEEELKKKNTSLGVKKLMKADTSGMKKLSSFFTKAPTKAK